ncbi:hypothetical protein CTI12_AA072720 [Artemisia annua]|uniref:RRM domain-containing protein n=1 Tax=Artemisia annua TaxID=35608 RepID=A0A2U1NH93_ARTAN|nr:hypothetical protein CTI12_AA072720 [Artemisia annua]
MATSTPNYAASSSRKKAIITFVRQVNNYKWKRQSKPFSDLPFRMEFPNSKRSVMDDLARISLSVYVANFPSHLTIRELRNICGKAGTLVDVYIAKHKNALGQMFGFCRFIKLRLYACIAKHDRKLGCKSSFTRVQNAKPVAPVASKSMPVPNASLASSYVNVAKGQSKGEAKAFNSAHEGSGSHIPSIILSQDTSNEFLLGLLRCFKDFRAIANTKNMCHNEGFLNVDFKYLGGLWVLFDFDSEEARNKFLSHKGILTWFSSLIPWYNEFVVDERLVWLEIEGVPVRAWDNLVFTKIFNRWGEIIFIDESDVCNRLSKRLCIKSTHMDLIFVSVMVTLNNVNYTIRVRELCSWTPTFASIDNDSDEDISFGAYDKSDNDSNGDGGSGDGVSEFDVDDGDGGSKTDADPIVDKVLEDFALNQEAGDQVLEVNLTTPKSEGKVMEPPISDPFELDKLIKKSSKPQKSRQSITPEFPPGFSSNFNNVHASSDSVHNLEHNSSAGDMCKHPGSSMQEHLEETIKVGLALGLDMEGCEKTLASLINEIGDKDLNK